MPIATVLDAHARFLEAQPRAERIGSELSRLRTLKAHLEGLTVGHLNQTNNGQVLYEAACDRTPIGELETRLGSAILSACQGVEQRTWGDPATRAWAEQRLDAIRMRLAAKLQEGAEPLAPSRSATRRTAGDLGAIDLYYLFRLSQPGRINWRNKDGSPKLVTISTVNAEVQVLRTAMLRYQAEHSLIGVPKLKLWDVGPAPVRWLARHEVARILWALRGRTWVAGANGGPGGWKVDEAGRRVIERRLLLADRSAYLARLVLLLVYTGSTVDCVLRLRWDGDAEGSASYVDLDTMLEQRRAGATIRKRGHLYRLGKDASPWPSTGKPVRLAGRMMAHLDRWRKMDGGRHILIVHPPATGRTAGCKNPNTEWLAQLWAKAGLEGVTLEALSVTCAVWILRAGTRELVEGKDVKPFEQSPAIMRSAAFFVGKSYMSVRDRLGMFDQDFHRAQKAALSEPAETVR